jgi:hypothetical protein
MNKKDIALTVGGVISTMVFAYLLYRLQQRDAATAAAAAAVAASASSDSYSSQQVGEYSLASQLPTISVSSLDTSNEGSTDTTGGTSTDASASSDTLLSNIIASFAGAINGSNNGASVNASIIPTLTSNPSQSLTNIPTTVQGAQAGVASNFITGTQTAASGTIISPGGTGKVGVTTVETVGPGSY